MKENGKKKVEYNIFLSIFFYITFILGPKHVAFLEQWKRCCVQKSFVVVSFSLLFLVLNLVIFLSFYIFFDTHACVYAHLNKFRLFKAFTERL